MTQAHISATDLYNIVSLSDPRLSPDGRWLACVRTQMDRERNEYRSAVWLAPSAGGPPRPFTSGDRRDKQPRWSPDGRWLAFVSDRDNDAKKTQIYLMPTDGGEGRRLTRMENGASDPAWSPDGARLAFVSRVNAQEMAAESEPEPVTPAGPEEAKLRAEEKARKEKEKADPRVIRRFAYRAETKYLDDRSKHLYVVNIDPETGLAKDKPRRLTEKALNFGNPRWLPDGSGLLASVDRKPGVDDMFYHSDLVRVPLDGGEVEILTGLDTADEDPRPSPDGQWIAYCSRPVDDLASANTEIKLIPVSGGEPRVLTAALDGHAQSVRWSPDGQRLLFLVPHRGRIDLRGVPVKGGAAETLVTSDRMILEYDLSSDGQQVGFVASTDRAPWDLYSANVDGSGEKRLTEVNAEWLAHRALAEVEDHWFKSLDGTDIQGWILKPPDWKAGQRAPTVLSIHGGPHVMWSRHEPSMWHEWQLLAGSGYLVFACNPRGSDGYGREFRASLIEHWGEADLPDLQAGLEQIIARGEADPEKLVVTGGSYGGFMTTWVIGHDQRFKAAVAQRGVYDLLSFYGTTDIPRFTERELGAAPWEDPQKLWRFSPIAYVEDIRTPLLLIHSENDFRAPIPAAEGMFVALRRLER
ncbi:S9 family peptidase, partial [Chloroflexota bacterium]